MPGTPVRIQITQHVAESDAEEGWTRHRREADFAKRPEGQGEALGPRVFPSMRRRRALDEQRAHMIDRLLVDPSENHQLAAQVELLDRGAAQIDRHARGRQSSFRHEGHTDVRRIAATMRHFMASTVLDDGAGQHEVRRTRDRAVGFGVGRIRVEHLITLCGRPVTPSCQRRAGSLKRSQGYMPPLTLAVPTP